MDPLRESVAFGQVEDIGALANGLDDENEPAKDRRETGAEGMGRAVIQDSQLAFNTAIGTLSHE